MAVRTTHRPVVAVEVSNEGWVFLSKTVLLTLDIAQLAN
jgi:hypothetical protein